MVEEEDLLDKLEDVDHPVCQQATDALLTAESEADQVPVRYDTYLLGLLGEEFSIGPLGPLRECR